MSIFGKKGTEKPKKEVAEKTSKKVVKESTTAGLPKDTCVAISMSLYFYLNERHDIESDIITIKQSPNTYTLWNSKVFGINNILK
jgi:hypothetical protein